MVSGYYLLHPFTEADEHLEKTWHSFYLSGIQIGIATLDTMCYVFVQGEPPQSCKGIFAAFLMTAFFSSTSLLRQDVLLFKWQPIKVRTGY